MTSSAGTTITLEDGAADEDEGGAALLAIDMVLAVELDGGLALEGLGAFDAALVLEDGAALEDGVGPDDVGALEEALPLDGAPALEDATLLDGAGMLLEPAGALADEDGAPLDPIVDPPAGGAAGHAESVVRTTSTRAVFGLESGTAGKCRRITEPSTDRVNFPATQRPGTHCRQRHGTHR